MRFLTLVLFATFSAFAQAEVENLKSADAIDQELLETFGDDADVAESLEENEMENLVESFRGPGRHRGGGPIYRPNRPYPRPYPRPLPRPYPRPRPYPAPAPRLSVACYADNEFGQRFTGWGYWATDAQRNAINECYRYSRSCVARGCTYY